MQTKYYYLSSRHYYGVEAKWVECTKSQYNSIKRAIPDCPIKVAKVITD